MQLDDLISWWRVHVPGIDGRDVREGGIDVFRPAEGYGFMLDRTHFHIANRIIPRRKGGRVVQGRVPRPIGSIYELADAPPGEAVVYEIIDSPRGPRAYRWALVSDIMEAIS